MNRVFCDKHDPNHDALKARAEAAERELNELKESYKLIAKIGEEYRIQLAAYKGETCAYAVYEADGSLVVIHKTRDRAEERAHGDRYIVELIARLPNSQHGGSL